jgi:hypothetical protein
MVANSSYHISIVSEMFEIMLLIVGFEVLTAAVMKSTVFWDITPCCNLLKDNRRFGEIYRLYLQGKK